MRITSLEVINFRNYESARLAPCDGVTVLFGDNAQGKTALLEAVVLSCTGRSHRTPFDRELIRWGESQGRVAVTTLRRDGSHDVEMLLNQRCRKTVKVNGSSLGRTGELMGHVSGVLFAPEDLRLVKDGPGERRRFVDMALSQIRPTYYYELQRYAHALAQRNRLLKDIALNPGLDATLDDWDAQLALHGAMISRARGEYLTRVAEAARLIHADITGGREALSAAYEPSVPSPDREALLEALQTAREIDKRRGTTTVGPHRDDVALTLNGTDARAYGSQGQQRTAALSLKLAELEIMSREIGETPVLLLDDVMSELDPQRRRQLLTRLRGVQTIVTCTDLSDLAEADIGAAWRVREGHISKETPV